MDTTFGNQGKLIIDVPDAGDFVTGLRADNNAVLVWVDSTAQYRAGSDNGEAHTQRLFRIAGNQLDSQFGSNGVLQIPIDSQWAMQADRTLVSTVVFHQNDPDNEDDDEYVPAWQCTTTPETSTQVSELPA